MTNEEHDAAVALIVEATAKLKEAQELLGPDMITVMRRIVQLCREGHNFGMILHMAECPLPADHPARTEYIDAIVETQTRLNQVILCATIPLTTTDRLQELVDQACEEAEQPLH